MCALRVLVVFVGETSSFLVRGMLGTCEIDWSEMNVRKHYGVCGILIFVL